MGDYTTSTNITPIGVAVKTDKCSFTIALRYANPNSPDTGTSTSEDTRHGGYNQDLTDTGILISSDETTAITDYNGKKNTAALIALETYQSGWKTDSTIDNSYFRSDHFPAALCCWRYYTVGTKQGDWYLPSLGEWYQAYLNYSDITTAINKVGYSISRDSHRTSTQYDATKYAWRHSWSNNTMAYSDRSGAVPVRPFSAY